MTATSHNVAKRTLTRALVLVALAASSVACSKFVKPTLPGETSYSIDALELVSADAASPLTLDATPLLQLLAVRPDIFIIAGQPYNPYRAGEDRRRIAMYWQNNGYFDVQVDAHTVTFNDAEKTANVRWTITEGPVYKVGKLAILGAPPKFESQLQALVTHRPGDPVLVTPFRLLRHDLADVLRDAGHMRAEVYNRMWVDRDAKTVDQTFYVDAGPKSVIGKITVLGNAHIPADAIIARSGLKEGDAFDLPTHIKREQDLADTAAFQNIRIAADTGTEFQTETASWESWIPPDTGGIMRAGQVADDGSYQPRELPAAVDVTLTVVEAPSQQVALEAGVNIDPERVYPFIGTRLVLRNAFGALHHLTVQGNVGYGVRWRGDVDEPLGIYGNARITYTRPGLFGRIGDFRITASFDDRLHPGFNWRTARLATGVRWLADLHLFFDVEASVRWDTGVGLGIISEEIASAVQLSRRKDNLAGELRLQLVSDTRNDPVEALSGHLVALRAYVAPVGTATWFGASIDLRAFVRLGQDLGLGFRVSHEQVHDLGLANDAGVPVGVKAFGGGAWGMRGFGTRRLSRYGQACGGAASDGGCRTLPLGATSLVEASAELRWLPYRKQFGGIAFVDVGAAGASANPFESGIEVAAGLGLRARLWHLTVALDLAYRLTKNTVHDGLDRFLGFIRIGEAF